MLTRLSKVVISLVLCVSLLPLVNMHTAWADEGAAVGGAGSVEGIDGAGANGVDAGEALGALEDDEGAEGAEPGEEGPGDGSFEPEGFDPEGLDPDPLEGPTDEGLLGDPADGPALAAIPPVAKYSIEYRASVAGKGWQAWKKDGKTAGTTGKGRAIEALNIKLKGTGLTGGVEYRTHVQSKGWLDYVKDGKLSGTTGKGLRTEAVSVRLTGELASAFDIYYRVHSQAYGWLGWAKNGADAGTTGLGLRMEAIEIRLVAKGDAAPGPTAKAYVKPAQSLQGRGHVQSIGWQAWVAPGKTIGTTGRGLRLEAFALKVANPNYSGSVQYKAYVTGVGWQGWKSNGATAGTTGQGRQLRAVQIKLTGKLADKYDVFYRVHSAKFGWLGWAKNGEVAGVSGFTCRMEALQVRLVAKGGKAPGSTVNPLVKLSYTSQGNVATKGWLDKGTGKRVVGTTGKSLRLEAFKLSVASTMAGGIEYNAYVQDDGWKGWKKNGAVAGAEGQGKRIEAIRIRLTGDLANSFDVYYRAHVQGMGWMGWAKNGANTGTNKLALKMEAFEIAIVLKGSAAPGSTMQPFTDTQRIRSLDPSKPMIALTFDDGPGIYTTKLLNLLDKYHARATFFVVGSNVNNYPSVVRDAYNRGNEIAGHSMNHQDFTFMSFSAVQNEINRTNQTIKNATGNQPPPFYRAPGGAFNQTVTNASAGVGHSLIQWSIDPRDWEVRNADTVYRNVMGAAKPGAIVVLHDIHPTTITAMERVIPDLEAKGYQIVTVSELMYYSKTPWVPGKVYYSAK